MKLYNRINKIKNNVLNNVVIVTHSTLSILDNEIEFESNGLASNILITYSGAGTFFDNTPVGIQTKIGKTSILITNVFRKEIPKIILQYSGDITINSCQVMNFDGTKIRSTINNNQNEQLFNKSETNFEVDSLILYDEPKIKVERSPNKSRLVKPTISANTINKFGKIEKYSKKEKEEFTKTIIRNVPIFKRTKISQKEAIKPMEKIIKPKKQKVIKEPRKQTNTIRYEGGK